MENNETLKGLVMVRKNINDSDGKEIMELIKLNKRLERLELEITTSQPLSCKALSAANHTFGK